MMIFTIRRFTFLLGMAITVLFLNLFAPSPSHAEEFSTLQKQELNKLVEQYIMKNPEVILKAVENLRIKQQQAESEQALNNMASLQPQLMNDPLSPIAGNPKGDVTIVEFFDYRCGYCKKVRSDLQTVLETDKNVRLVFKEFPILGPDSVTASRAALAVWNIDPSKYPAYHNELMKSRGNLTKTKALEIASDLGLKSADIESEMSKPGIDLAINQNRQLAEALNISGTPAFIIGDQLIPGAIDLKAIRNIIKETRASQGG